MHVAQSVELIAPIPGLYNDQIIFLPTRGSPQGNILHFFNLIITSLKWCALIQYGEQQCISHKGRLTYLEMISRTQGNVAQPTPQFWHWKAPLLPPSSKPMSLPKPTTSVSCFWAPNASLDPNQSRGSTTCWSKSSIDLKQLCAVEHYILIRVAWWL